MKINLSNHLFKICSLFLIILILKIPIANAQIYNDIKVSGNKRLSIETVLMFSGLETNIEISLEDLNLALKKLYETNYFKEVEFITSDDVLKIIIVENPIIQSVRINGIKNKSIEKQIIEITKKSEKYPYLKSKVQDEKNLLLNIVRSSGFYFSEIETKVIDNKNNSVDLIYNFKLGERAIIKNINFQGNKIFKDSKLRNVIKSEEGKFWKFLTSDKYLDERKIKIDEDLLRNYYKNKGL